MATYTLTDNQCYHCGTAITSTGYILDEKNFCCIGCQSVYQVLNSNNLCSYYSYNDSPGQTQHSESKHFEYLDESGIITRLIDYSDENITTVTFYIPAIHCSSCIWLLEHLHKLNAAVVNSRIDFLKKQVSITFKQQQFSLRKLVELLVSLGYEPLISLQDVVKDKQNTDNRDLIKKIAVAGFCMGNVMLLSFPEYFGLSSFDQQFKSLFGWLNLAFAIPVTFYCGRIFFSSAWAGLKHKIINLDAPLALIIAVLFLRSAFEIISSTGPGFTDTLTGLIFLLLMGRWVKQRTYHHLSFDRDYRSYFPVAVTVLKKEMEKPVAIEELSIGDRILIRNNEIIPADAILMRGEAYVDFSFVTGESAPLRKVLGEMLYAGGRQIGEAIELEVIKPVSQSYLTGLWNNETFKITDNKLQNFNDMIAKYFSLATFIIAFSAAGFWIYSSDSSKAWSSFTAVLIVACPCVLALSTPFTLSAVLSIFDKNRFYLKNTDVVEQLAKIDTIVFDKTGTITSADLIHLSFSGDLSAEEKILVASLARNSSHPLSREIVKWLDVNTFREVMNFTEIAGKGICGTVNGRQLKLGKSTFVSSGKLSQIDSAQVQLDINGIYKGCFKIKQQWRSGLNQLLQTLSQHADLHLLSGDNESERENLSHFFPVPEQMHFAQSPQNKLDYIKNLQSEGHKVMMLGDGLNDAGALKQSNLGVAVTDNINNFNPGCDAILDGSSMMSLSRFMTQATDAVKTIHMSLVISASYNLVGIYFAVQGILSPLTAAVLMPLSTITIIIFTSVSARYFAGKNRLNSPVEQVFKV
ncbi:heavy metal translocating P-type ATPase [Daejeonella oryzae]|uniref:heavy metal translocating P-type ATPase n=1 Tax=Daejeonella oryzae TaxID=1122943 RepID=UPI0004178C6F|nr:heavy metal translocating P-type ATPase metal-binding domain-containing protein [Daejeonella oryzae]